jgi:hypothetical protein
MSTKLRGSDQLKMQCGDIHALTREEIEKVAGGGAIFASYFPRGIPWPDLFTKYNQTPVTIPVNQLGGALKF